MIDFGATAERHVSMQNIKLYTQEEDYEICDSISQR
jgi:hypothetical protein